MRSKTRIYLVVAGAVVLAIAAIVARRAHAAPVRCLDFSAEKTRGDDIARRLERRAQLENDGVLRDDLLQAAGVIRDDGRMLLLSTISCGGHS